MTNKAKIREIFTSIQGEGPYVGTKQLFIRFCGCNLNCAYCDTDFEAAKSKDYTVEELINKINEYGEIFTISLTGGEPLCSAAFLKDFLPEIRKYGHKIYLETNATLPEALERIIDSVDVVSADIKLTSSTGMNIDSVVYEKFYSLASKKECFAKVVFNEAISDEEINFCVSIAQKYGLLLILQPEMKGNDFSVTSEFSEIIFEKFYTKYSNIRLIPQVHKFINLR
ncbi:MAG: 7-carboxy-7-deazaguanine synthase QueE [Brachyspira sp.]|nr:7-carboxy-7-deazaguanine synthase QueE [Brachyspira sp.]